jgi:tetratricopeptide (TPR) repeat protein
LVTGTVDQAIDSVTASVRLVDARSMTQLGHRTVRARAGDIQAIEAAIGEEVSVFLRTQLGGRIQSVVAAPLTRNPRAWDLAQRALALKADASSLFHRAGATAAGPILDRADSLLALAEAVEHSSPSLAIARAGLAEERATVMSAAPPTPSGSSPTSNQTRRTLELDANGWRRTGLLHADRALRLEPGNAEALETRAILLFGLWESNPVFGTDSIRVQIMDDLMAALDRRQGRPIAWTMLSQVYDFSGRFAEADFAAHKALEADPFLADEAAVISRLMYTALNLGNDAAASDWCRRGRRRHPGDLRFTGCELVIAGWSSRDVPAAWALLASLRLADTLDLGADWDAARQMSVAAVIARAGLKDSALRTATRAMATASRPHPPHLVVDEAQVLALAGDTRGAVQRITEVTSQLPQLRPALRTTARFRTLATDPGFLAATSVGGNRR